MHKDVNRGRVSMKRRPILKGFHQETFLVLYWLQQNALNCLLVDAAHGLVACIQEGRNTIWPHNPQTGWSYCVMIPSWITQTPEAGVTADSFLKSVVVSTVYLVVYLVGFLFLLFVSMHAVNDLNTVNLVAFHMPIGRCFRDCPCYTINLATCVTKLLWTNEKWKRNYSAKTVFLLRTSPFTVFGHLNMLTIFWDFNVFLKDCVTYSLFCVWCE